MDDHTKGCEGRNYTCTCGYEAERDAEIKRLRTGIKRLSDEEELCAETTGDDPFSMVYLAAKLAAAEDVIRRNEVLFESKDETIRQLSEERSELRAALSKILGYDRNFYDNGRPGYEAIARDALASAEGQP